MPEGFLISFLAGILIGVSLFAGIYFFVLKPNDEERVALVDQEIREKRSAAETESTNIVKRAEAEARQTKSDADRAAERRFADLARTEERLDNRQNNLDNQVAKLETREQVLNKRQSRLDKRQNELESLESMRQQELQKVAQMTVEEAKRELLSAVETESRQDMARIMREIEDEARETAEERARKLISVAMQRVASDHVAEATVSAVQIPSDDMKGRIIGRNGRNIRAFEMAAGVDVVVDDTPETVTVSSFDPVRREVAKRALTKLIQDGRIHPARIEKVVKDAQEEVERAIVKAGEQAAYETNVHGLHREILKVLGRLKFRTSYGQNQLEHAIEASKIAAALAAELGANVEISKMGGLLHDLGKAMDHDQEGTHAGIGAEFARRFKVPAQVVNAIASHHHEVEQESVEAIIVEVADAISGARPGARRESLENYIKRVRTLEEIAVSYEGVEEAYALQAGREIRVLVKPGNIDDYGSRQLSKNIAKTIEESMQYPGQIQVTVIRETRSVSFAK
jgi:ribonuclease Y